MQFVNQFFARMSDSLGPERARACISETLSATGLRQLRTPDDVVVFASNLMQRGGFVEVMGGALRVQAILRGATDKTPRPKQKPLMGSEQAIGGTLRNPPAGPGYGKPS
jgi:hypothetical protein